MHCDLGDLPAAFSAYRPSLETRERAAAAEPGNADCQRELSVSQEKLGDAFEAQGDLTAGEDLGEDLGPELEQFYSKTSPK